MDFAQEREKLVAWSAQAGARAYTSALGSKFLRPEAVLWVHREDGWEMSALFQSPVRAARAFAAGGYDKPTALVFRDHKGWDVEFANI